MAIKILIAEDEEITLKHLLYNLKNEGYEVTGVHNGLEAWDRIQKEKFDVVIADIKMPEMDGLILLGKLKEKYPDIKVIIITGFGTIDSAVEAMKKGAEDYITKPFNFDELILKLGKIQEKKSLQRENVALKVSLGLNKDLPFIAKSKGMKEIVNTIKDISSSDCNVFITGETGTGKGLLAKLIHYSSWRKEKPFIGINCAVFTEELLASELFGHEKGAFTGAITSKQGLVEIADTGTLFLDEVTEMSPNLQAKLLNFIEEGEFFRVGGIKPIKVDVRFIAATNQHVSSLITDGRFREDLYYRLNVMEIFIPPLRERNEDIEILSKYFLDKYLPKSNKKITGFTEEAMDILMDYSFPGNVRELENIIERAVILEKTSLITPDSLPQTIRVFHIETLEPNRIKTIDNLSRDYAEKVLEMVGGNKSKAAELLGISRTSLWRILKK